MKSFAALLFRVLLVAVCCFATWMSVRHARADLAAAPGTAAALERARRIEPGNLEVTVWDALLRSYGDDPSPAVDDVLLRASRVNPFNSELLMTLGLRAEFRGDNANAERYLLKATEIDHSFKPAWTFANFAVRTGQPEKFWPMARRCLNLDPLVFDPRPVFALAWRVTDDGARVKELLPRAGPLPIQYLGFLMDTNRVDAAIQLWPEALASFEPSNPGDTEILTRYCDFMAASSRMSTAVRAWNGLVDRNIVRSGRLDPANALSIADPDFSFPPAPGLFGWQPSRNDGVFVTSGASALHFELDGNEPQSFLLLSTTAAVLPGKAYRLNWKYDASQLISPQDPGFQIWVLQKPESTGAENARSECPPFLSAGESGSCPFTSGPDTEQLAIQLRYARASGTTRARGTLILANIHLEFAP